MILFSILSMIKIKNQWFWLISGCGLALDQWTKIAVVEKLKYVHNSYPFWQDMLHFTYVINTGAAYSFFQGGVGWLKWLSITVSLGLLIYGLLAPRLKILEQLTCGLILAGALGNGIDRFLYGYVVDFLELRFIRFPVFNIADICVSLGMLCFAIVLWQDTDNSRHATESRKSDDK